MVKHIAFFRCLRHIVQNNKIKQKQLQMGGENCWFMWWPCMLDTNRPVCNRLFKIIFFPKKVLAKKKCSNWPSSPKSARFFKKWSTDTLSTLFCTFGGSGSIDQVILSQARGRSGSRRDGAWHDHSVSCLHSCCGRSDCDRTPAHPDRDQQTPEQSVASCCIPFWLLTEKLMRTGLPITYFGSLCESPLLWEWLLSTSVRHRVEWIKCDSSPW